MLKIIAIIMMTADHADRILFMEKYPLLTIMGRFAFPLFAFMIARNALHTRNAYRYIGLLFLFGLVSQPIYALALNHDWLQPLNVLFTLGLGLLAVQTMVRGQWWALALTIAAGWFVDYGMEGVALIPAIAYTIQSIHQRGLEHYQTLSGFALVLGLACLINTWNYVPFVIAALALGFMTLLPQLDRIERQLRWPGFRLFFYCYYPGHLALLAILAWLLGITPTI